jgi:sialate O-acetylesterase
MKSLKTNPYDRESNPTPPTLLFNGFIAPVSPLVIKGAIWYQGETNGGRGFQYRRILPALIEDWRKAFRNPDMPFYISTLANFGDAQEVPGDDYWAELREAQILTASTIKHSGIAVTIDVGEANDVHPKNKQAVGERLALNALAKDFGKAIAYQGPTYAKHRVSGNKLIVTMAHSEGELVLKAGKVSGFAIAGDDKKWHWAEASIKGNEIALTCADVPKPVAARYGWHINPPSTLSNRVGLPAVPFRTDDWPAVSLNNK